MFIDIQLLRNEAARLKYLYKVYGLDSEFNVTNPEQREFTVEELAKYNGVDGKPAYVAVNGVVYDVSLEPTWGGATHFGLYAGRDVTTEFIGCHGREEILRNLPKVGVFKI